MDNVLHAKLLHLVSEGDLTHFKSVWSTLSEEEKKEHLQYKDEELGYGVFSVAMDHLDEETAPMAAFLVSQGAADPPLGPREAWSKLVVRINPETNASLSPKLAAGLELVWDAMVERGIGRTESSGHHWGLPHFACQMSWMDEEKAIARLQKMKACGYDLDQKDEIGETPMHLAAWSAAPDVMSYLLDEHASLHSTTSGGRDILDFVFREKSDDIKQSRMPQMIQCLGLLVDHGFDVEDAMSKVQFKTMELWRDRYMPVLVAHEADQISKTTPIATRPRNSPRL